MATEIVNMWYLLSLIQDTKGRGASLEGKRLSEEWEDQKGAGSERGYMTMYTGMQQSTPRKAILKRSGGPLYQETHKHRWFQVGVDTSKELKDEEC